MKSQTHFGEYLAAKKILTAAVFAILVYKKVINNNDEQLIAALTTLARTWYHLCFGPFVRWVPELGPQYAVT